MFKYVHTESVEQGYVNFRGEGQRTILGQMIKVTYFKTQWSVILIATTFYMYVQLEHILLVHDIVLAHVHFT